MLRIVRWARRIGLQPGAMPRSIPSYATVPAVSRRAVRAAVVALCCAAFGPPASAQFFFFDKYQPRVIHRPQAEVYHPRHARRADPPSAQAAKKPRKQDTDDGGRPLFAVISIEDQSVAVYGANGLIERDDISSGMPGHATPTGVFAVIGKERWHESNLYSGAPMPFMQRITWSGVAMHQGQLPGYAASHGCIRLHGDFAERWFKMTKVGLRVLISPSDIEPVGFTDPRLPVPRYWPQPVNTAAVRAPVQSAALANDQLAALADPSGGVVELNPIAYAVAEKQKAKAELKAAEQAEGDAGDAVQAASLALKDAQKVQRIAERNLAAAEDRLAWFGANGHRLPSPQADYGDGLMVAIENVSLARTEAGAAQRELRAAEAKAAEAAMADKAADDHTEALKARISEMGRRQETVSVFISRKEGRLYVRQALRPVFDVPVTIKDPDQALGTHVFVAAPPAPGEKALRWSALTLPVEVRLEPRSARARRAKDDDDGSIGTAIATESPAGALARIEIPGEVMDKLSELVWTGSSIIISDHGLTNETGLGTDFIVETRY